jgi:hypothetical protein
MCRTQVPVTAPTPACRYSCVRDPQIILCPHVFLAAAAACRRALLRLVTVFIASVPLHPLCVQVGSVRRTFLFHIRGSTLTFSAGTPGGAMTRQAGSWVLPEQFYLLLATQRLGYEFRMSLLQA